MPIRNPFARRPGAPNQTDENVRPAGAAENPSNPGFERVDTIGSKASSALSITSSRRSNDTGEYKMSVVNDSGVYLPPSPIEKEASWPKRYLSRNSEDTRSSVGADNEHFTISRESFDSYRRSFDISARSPVSRHDTPTTRQSLDSARFPRSRVSMNERRIEPPTAEEPFEDVGLNDDQHRAEQQQPRKKGFFSKFGSDSHSHPDGQQQQQSQQPANATSTPMVSRFLMTGRKRAQSGSQELRSMERPTTANSTEVPVDSKQT